MWVLTGRLILTDWLQGSIYIPPEGGAGYVRLKVNNDIIASTGTNGVYAVYPSSISVLHNLQAGDILSIEYEAVGDAKLLG